MQARNPLLAVLSEKRVACSVSRKGRALYVLQRPNARRDQLGVGPGFWARGRNFPHIERHQRPKSHSSALEIRLIIYH